MRIGILKTGTAPRELQAEHGDYDTLFQRLLRDEGFDFHTYHATRGDLPSGAGEMDGWIITGSRHGVYEDHPWLAGLEGLLRDLYRARNPMVGICFGHQVLAKALGGRVEKFAGGWSIGPTKYETEDGRRVCLNAWHQDQVLSLPQGARRVLASSFCQNAGLAYEDIALTIQPHPEFSRDFVGALFDVKHRELPAEAAAVAKARLSSEMKADDLSATLGTFLRERRVQF